MPKKLIGFSEGAPAMGKDVRDTDMLKPGAREPASTVSASNKLKPAEFTHKAFGKLGNRGSGK